MTEAQQFFPQSDDNPNYFPFSRSPFNVVNLKLNDMANEIFVERYAAGLAINVPEEGANSSCMVDTAWQAQYITAEQEVADARRAREFLEQHKRSGGFVREHDVLHARQHEISKAARLADIVKQKPKR